MSAILPTLDEQLATYIAGKVAKKYGVSIDDLKSRSRLGNISEARQISMYLMREHKWSLAAIGAWFNRDHATAMNAVMVVQNRIDTNKEFRIEMRILRAENPFRARVYIAGKVRGLPYDEVERKFQNAEDLLISMGYEVVNPLKQNLPINNEAVVWRILLPKISMCEIIAFLWDYKDSEGCAREMLAAEWLELKQYYITPNYDLVKTEA
ncbi:Chromosomal replication initiator protein DnaA [bioreactor metagenome]|uniref:Chromosomal replication initiator protein DnaA n=1 Tax=bioreactor metagenome TaxID=1076179 RepID=A0A644X350_9ZZZZ